MPRALFGLEKGLRIYGENSDSITVDVLIGSGAPLGTSGETDEANIGSIYSDYTNGVLYQKVTDTSSSSDWLIDRNFSIKEILPTEILKIKSTEEMIVLSPIINRGRIINHGIIRTPNFVQSEPEPFVQLDQFDYWDIPVNKTVLIPATQIMHPGNILKNKGTIRNLGKVQASPTLDYIPELEQGFPYELILPTETVTIRERQQMLLKGILRNQGRIINKGRVVLI